MAPLHDSPWYLALLQVLAEEQDCMIPQGALQRMEYLMSNSPAQQPMIQMLKSMMQLDPAVRPTAEELLANPLFQS